MRCLRPRLGVCTLGRGLSVVSPSYGRPRAVFASFPGGCAVPFRSVVWRGLVTAKDADAASG